MEDENRMNEELNFDDLLAQVEGNEAEPTPENTEIETAPELQIEDAGDQIALDEAGAGGFGGGEVDIDTFMDIVFCIDITGSMGPTINKVKSFTTSLYHDLVPYMLEHCHREVKALRVKVIGFRDFYCDGKYALEQSDFFTLPAENDQFKAFVEGLQAKGGGDNPENSLEALALAMRSDWVKVVDLGTQRARHVVVLFTDDEAHKLERRNDFHAPEGYNYIYPDGLPADLNELTMMWNQGVCGAGEEFNMDKRAKRLIIFAPEDSYPWNEIAEEWEGTVVLPMEKGAGGLEVARDVIINTIGNTI